MSLGKKALSGALWNLFQRAGTALIEFLVTLILARYLSPGEFGLLAMMALFIAIANNVMDSGFTEALIRKSDVKSVDLDTVFYSNLVMGMVAYTILFFSAPIIAGFYQEEKLLNLIRVTGLVVLINASRMVHVAILSRKLNFKRQLQATIPAVIISGVVAVTLAQAGVGVWSLVVQMLVTAFVSSGIYWRLSIWRPGFRFRRSTLRELFGFGSRLFGANLNNIVFENIYVLVIARIFSATVAGHYFLADKIKNMLLQLLVGTMQTVMYPAFASIQNETEKLKSGFRQIVKVTTFILFPLLLFVAALAKPLFSFLLPEDWSSAAPYLQLLCFTGLLYPLHAINLNVLKVKGRSELILYLDIIKKLFMIFVLFVSYRFGVIGILIGQFVGSVISYVPNSYYSSRLIGYSIKEQLADIYPSLLLSAAIAGAVFVLVELLPLTSELQLTILGLASVAAYLGLAVMFKMSSMQVAVSILGIRRIQK